MRDIAIMALPGLQNGGVMTSDEIAEAAGLSGKWLTDRLNTMVRLEQLERIPGVAKSPARYKIKKRAVAWPPFAKAASN